MTDEARVPSVAESLRQRIQRASTFGYSASELPERSFVAKPGSHDDGPAHGMFLGAVGGPALSRDLTGRFTRWHLQPGTHLVADVDGAFFVAHWQEDGEHHHVVLRRDDVAHHETAALFPVSHERFSGKSLPFVLTLSAFSPPATRTRSQGTSARPGFDRSRADALACRARPEQVRPLD